MTHPVVKRDRFYLIAALGLILLAGYMGSEDERMAQAEAQEYEDMVCMWQSDVAAGVPEVKANGHPDYDNRGIQCPKS